MNFGPQAGRRIFLPMFQGFCGALASKASTILTNKIRTYLTDNTYPAPITYEPTQSTESWKRESKMSRTFE